MGSPHHHECDEGDYMNIISAMKVSQSFIITLTKIRCRKNDEANTLRQKGDGNDMIPSL